MSYLKEHPIDESWFRNKVTPQTVEYADMFAKNLAKGDKRETLALTTSQLRRFFGAMKNLQMNIQISGFNESEFVMLKPQLAYAVGRAYKNNGSFNHYKIDDFKDVLSKAIDIVNASEDKDLAFNNFIKFFEAIVAYHKVYGKDN